MSCLHITGTRRIGNDAPFRFTGKRDRTFEIEQNARYENPKVRAAAAAHPMAPESILLDLSWDTDVEVRQWVARNPRATVRVLLNLAVDRDAKVRAFVAWNPNAPLYLIENFKNDPDEAVRNVAETVLDNRAED